MHLHKQAPSELTAIVRHTVNSIAVWGQQWLRPLVAVSLQGLNESRIRRCRHDLTYTCSGMWVIFCLLNKVAETWDLE